MDWLFDRKFVYNWTANPGRPGLADYLIFSVKYAIIVVAFFFALIGHPAAFETAGFLLAPFIEEQARIYWMRQATAPLRAGLLFSVFISISELVEPLLFSTTLASGVSGIDTIAIRVVPTIFHFVFFFLGFSLLRRGISVVWVWLLCSALHLFFNEILAGRFASFVESL